MQFVNSTVSMITKAGYILQLYTVLCFVICLKNQAIMLTNQDYMLKSRADWFIREFLFLFFFVAAVLE